MKLKMAAVVTALFLSGGLVFSDSASAAMGSVGTCEANVIPQVINGVTYPAGCPEENAVNKTNCISPATPVTGPIPWTTPLSDGTFL